MSITLILVVAVCAVVFLLPLFWLISLRRVVSPNEVHIVRRGGKTLVYGDENNGKHGNTYYQFPSGIPLLGVAVQKLSLAIFPMDLKDYEAYDKDRVPFEVDVTAFFRIANYEIAAARVSSTQELGGQLRSIVQGAVRAILAKEVLDKIMEERSTYGELFTKEVSEQLKAWGVETVKSIELMDVRDAKGEKVIFNIMEKQKSKIEMESRVEVAENKRKAEEAEIKAAQEIALKQQAKNETVGKREAEVEQSIGIAKEKSEQAVQEEAKTTKEKQMEVQRVETVRQAEINKEKLVVEAEAEKAKAEVDKQTKVTNAEAEKEKVKIAAEADKTKRTLDAEAELAVKTKQAEAILVTGQKNAEAITLEGEAKAKAKEAMELASVQGQIELAEKIGLNDGYQSYLVKIEDIKSRRDVGIEQAKNIAGANVKIISQSGDVASGLNSALDLFTPKGGSSIAAALESFAATDAGQALLSKLGLGINETAKTDAKANNKSAEGADFEEVK